MVGEGRRVVSGLSEGGFADSGDFYAGEFSEGPHQFTLCGSSCREWESADAGVLGVHDCPFVMEYCPSVCCPSGPDEQ